MELGRLGHTGSSTVDYGQTVRKTDSTGCSSRDTFLQVFAVIRWLSKQHVVFIEFPILQLYSSLILLTGIPLICRFSHSPLAILNALSIGRSPQGFPYTVIYRNLSRKMRRGNVVHFYVYSLQISFTAKNIISSKHVKKTTDIITI